MGFIADIFTGGGDTQRDVNRAAQQIQFDPFSIQGFGLGQIDASERGLLEIGRSQLADRFGQQFINRADQLFRQSGGSPFGALAGQLAESQAAIPNLNRNQLFAGAAGGAQQLLRDRDPAVLQGAGRDFVGAGRSALEAFRDFSPDDFAARQFERLNRLAAPGEATQTSAATQALFNRGRLGPEDAVGAETLGQLDLSQRLARDARLGQAIGLAGTEADRLFGQATGFAGQGAGLLGQAFGQRTGALGTAADLGLQGAGFARQSALDRFNLAGQALQLGGAQRQQQFGQGTALLDQLSHFQAQPLDLLNASIAAGTGAATAAQGRASLQAQGATDAANTRGSFFSGLFGAFSDARLKRNLVQVGTVPVYRWEWTEEAEELVGDQPNVGVVAQELQEVAPELVILDPVSGFLKVNYNAG